jgi:uncharacterized membrane protein YoaK (UPF0700 family)
MKTSSLWGIPILLGVTAGYVDTAGYLALQGLFTSHVTGNFVTLGASLVSGVGTLAKLLALPVFCVVIIVTRWASHALAARGVPVLRAMVSLKVILLATGATLAIHFGPFSSSDTGPALATGLTLVAAMAIQNAVQRIHLGNAPPSTVMTGTTTQLMLDIADMFGPAATKDVARARIARLSLSVIAFALGCGSAAFLYLRTGVYCFLVPPVLGASTLFFRLEAFRGDLERELKPVKP